MPSDDPFRPGDVRAHAPIPVIDADVAAARCLGDGSLAAAEQQALARLAAPFGLTPADVRQAIDLGLPLDEFVALRDVRDLPAYQAALEHVRRDREVRAEAERLARIDAARRAGR